MKSAAYESGFEDGRRGVDDDSNPYSLGSLSFDAWASGWEDGAALALAEGGGL